MADYSEGAAYLSQSYHTDLNEWSGSLPPPNRTAAPQGQAGVVTTLPREDVLSIVHFYYNEKTKKTHFFKKNPGEKDTLDRPATDNDRQHYPKQWQNFIHSNGVINKQKNGTPLSDLYPQRPSLIRQLEANDVTNVEQLANLSDTGIETIKDVGGVELVHAANRFLEQKPVMDRDKEIASLTAEIEKLKAENQALKATPPPPRRERVRLN